mmetsp:Transcript_13631/g.28583  ORF Transcript_13631/g.28583 Transcript_13631/m.28583 type:complete len:361 (-) Transcript_13631:276-1358(-)|eukprot:CAMPEP_0168195632 /NCGR_PEP_ID=MMETSP0139_2-20121125/19965_1 /TAXON_ID=44445 /ORGANISM="Pseudo-nitzschia australis, Strain 10249 10 AB" /LENGTH=360 /DNA_ID=CAMNT_0008119511 /DNA_START=130 /DNA_END=1212 /DNA_ORIENTATION=+
MAQSSSNAKVAPVDFFASPTFKMILLIGMVLQNSATVLVGRYTRAGIRVEDQYSVNHLIVITEIGKFLLSCVFEHVTTNGALTKSIRENIIDRPRDALKIMIPALLYLVQNTLLYVALSNLTAPLFQVTYQAKLVTTAIVSVIMLNRKYSPQQWVCLVALSVGVAVVVLDKQDDSKKKDDDVMAPQSLIVGLTAVSVACFSSALAGVYFEKVVKNPSGGKQIPVSVWMRNMQLAFFTIVIAVFQGLWSGSDPDKASLSYFHGFTFWPCVLVCLQAGGGLLVAAVIKYADNVLKGLATGVSVCFATAVSFVLFGTPISGQFVVGAFVILVSVYFFSNPMQKKEKGDILPSTKSAQELNLQK